MLDARSRLSYLKSHIKGAILADLFHYFVPGTDVDGLRRFQDDLAKRLGKLGLKGHETIVVYESRFGMRAARVAWMLEYAGLSRVSLLEGGFQNWAKSGFPVEVGGRSFDTRVFRVKPRGKILATSNEVHSSKSAVILDVRSSGEFRGTESRECDKRKGRIPGAKWFEWTNFLHNSDRFKNSSEIRSALEEIGLTRDKAIITYCHRGARAAAAYYALRSLGYVNVKNYIGSWHEWSALDRLPIERNS